MSNNSQAAGRPALQDASNRVNQTPILPPPIPWLTKAAGQSPAVAAGVSTTVPKSTNSKKRKSDTSLEDEVAAYKRNLNISTEGMAYDMTCNQVRSKINKLFEKGVMSKAEFCRTLNCNQGAVNTFLSKTGKMDGQYSNVYEKAWDWFMQRSLAGLKMPDVKKRRKTEAARAAAAPNTSGGGARPRGARKTAVLPPPAVDISNIHLPGEETNSVPVYDTCDEVRKKIAWHLDTPGLTAAQFCRDIYAQLSNPTIKSFQSKQLNDFCTKQGPNAGCRSKVFYAAYVYFEKIRIAEGKPKSEHRLNMEKIWAKDGGFDLEHDDTCGVWLGPGEEFDYDQYGQLKIYR
ncbi:hypothetical protein F4805DRAFT_472400 [Annulohypoxylon moriforme]|nr:hypothetical protein F4805DRAFT_472400 [Annulohypoxylon moriforme]